MNPCDIVSRLRFVGHYLYLNYPVRPLAQHHTGGVGARHPQWKPNYFIAGKELAAEMAPGIELLWYIELRPR